MSIKTFFTPEKYIKNSELNSKISPSELAKVFFKAQYRSWSLLNDNIGLLSQSLSKSFFINDFELKIKHIPHRIRSTAANIDADSISQRDCFLCAQLLPREQEGILFLEKYILLCNPYPIFNEHFTIPSIDHKPQEIYSHINDMIKFADLFHDDYLLFYNGPKCGASAPDHFHFQMCPQKEIPIVNYILKSSSNYLVVDENNSSTISLSHEDFPIPHVFLKTAKPEILQEIWSGVYKKIQQTNDLSVESMLNILIFVYDGVFHAIIFPRIKHRPDLYFEAGKRKIMISPAAIDLSGVFIVPRKEDYEKINTELILKINKEVVIDYAHLRKLIQL